MEIYYSNLQRAQGLDENKVRRDIREYLPEALPILVSYYGAPKNGLDKVPWASKTMLDSGAFSAFMQDDEIDIYEYIEYVRAWRDEVDVVIGLDVLDKTGTVAGKRIAAEASKANQLIMDEHEIDCVPVYHWQEPWSYWEYYLNNYEFVGIGGSAQIKSERAIRNFYNRAFQIREKVNPTCKVHGFGMNMERVMRDYPWHTVDATSACVVGRFGGIYTPWGTYKINPLVNAREARWMKHNKIRHERIRTWYDKNFPDIPWEVSQRQDPIGNMARTAVSVLYFEKVLAEINTGVSKPKNTRRGFDIHAYEKK